MEKIQVYNANLKSLGLMERGEAHVNGCWHKTFHCWLVSTINNGSLLFQLRSNDKKNYPNMFDITAAGHLVEFETDQDGIREVIEELGVPMDINDLYHLGYRIEVDDQDNGQKNREYQSVYIGKTDKNIHEFCPQKEEVSGLMWIGLDDAANLFSKKVEITHMQGIQYDTIRNSWVDIDLDVSIRDFIPRIQNYYLTISIMGKRLLNDQFPLAIS